MAKSAMIRARAEPEVKEKAEKIIHSMGLTPTAVITMLYRQIIRLRALPFQPSATTLAAMRDAELGRDLIRADSVADLIGFLDDGETPENGTPAGRDKTVQEGSKADRKSRVGHRASR